METDVYYIQYYIDNIQHVQTVPSMIQYKSIYSNSHGSYKCQYSLVLPLGKLELLLERCKLKGKERERCYQYYTVRH